MPAPPNRINETAFETVIESHFLTHGYQSTAPGDYDRERGIFPSVVIDFIRTTQAKKWSKLEALLGDKTEQQVIRDLCKWMDTYGSLDTLRHGFKCYGKKLDIAFFKAVHTMNPELDKNYAANRLGLTRQLFYSQKNNKSLDLVINLNGVPIITVELKNPLTGQTTDDAEKQYKQDRDPREILFEFKRRTLAHFAVDTESISMTTRLAGNATYFLPFNKGFDGGAGNPPDPKKRNYRTAYLWEDVLQRDSLLDITARFIHLQIEEKLTEKERKVKKEKMIFPRYHQLDAVRKLVNSAREQGSGNNYLVEHSAGSGKSNTISWLAHRLASLHDTKNSRVFDSVIVITDRRVLDKQLQDTIYQFEHKLGVVEKIDKHSRQLAEALQNGVPIVITTLQKFPFVSQQLIKIAEENGEISTGVLPTRKFAVIIDEAHSSQGGETATDLKEVLAGEDLVTEAAAKAREEGEGNPEELYRSMAKRGKQANISFFAFTATPKHKTLKVFGKKGVPAHRYSMRQAIEEGFILDVLKNYTTYATYFKLVQSTEQDINVERKKAAKALARFLKLHPHNIAQKTEVMVEHFHAVTRHKIGGHGKAMVVTGSRSEAVKYKLGFDKYIRAKGYPIKTLVAFSGEVNDDKIPDVSYTETGMNEGIKEKELPERFSTPEFHVLLVAEKYQTGFDQPLLHSMYVDKRLSGIQAVQTLSRLNRTHPLKEDTFVLDFVNDREDIKKAFKTYFEGAQFGEEADPANMYRIKSELDASDLYLPEDIEIFCAIYYKPKQRQSAGDHKTMNAVLDSVVAKFMKISEKEEEEAELLRSKLKSFRNLYGFLSQVIPYQDSDLEKIYIFVRHLAPKLPRRKSKFDYTFDDEIRLEYYRLQKISEGSINLRNGYADVLDGPTESGSGILREPEVWLSRLIDNLNNRFGTDFNPADQLFFDQLVASAIQDENIIQAAAANPKDKFELVFKNLLQTLFVERMDQNEEIFSRFMNEPKFQSVVTDWLADEAYQRLRFSKDEVKTD